MIGTPIVIVGPVHNGAREHSALVSRVREDGFVDATMFPDGGGDPVFVRVVKLLNTREQAMAPARTLTAYRVTPLAEPVPLPPPAVPAEAPQAEAPKRRGRPPKVAAPPPPPPAVKRRRKA